MGNFVVIVAVIVLVFKAMLSHAFVTVFAKDFSLVNYWDFVTKFELIIPIFYQNGQILIEIRSFFNINILKEPSFLGDIHIRIILDWPVLDV